ncbi:hypothetical protein [Candidatus Enterovibrio altilux]|uniref:Mobile element protein n=1 Tax=Candidatus Enterovibrio altilux TaxID=1927128 RepID=A0A291B9Q8_9GAMM|nr:hypothetical protein [Candidatus Enterovibrio luxaltus]ATF09740.1 hypothetical protein BTN50_1254 [Candidatus Enterovibrio luxaltus]
MINITFKMKNKGMIQYLAINFMGLIVYGADEWTLFSNWSIVLS